MSKAHELLAAENYAVEDARQEEKTTAAILLQTFGSSLVKLHVYAPDFVTEASERPEASRLARWQASHSDTVTTQQGLNLELEDVFVRHLLFLLDGTRDRAALLQELRTKIESGELPGEGQELADKETFLRELPEYLENNLQHLADSALLIS
jgi:methyltransferase-like protein